MLEDVGVARRGLRQHRRAARGAGRRRSPAASSWSSCRASSSRPCAPSAPRGGAAQRLARPPRPLPRPRRLRRGQGAHLRAPGRALDRGAQRRRRAGGGDRRGRRARARAGSRAPRRSPTAASSTASAVVEVAPGSAEPSCSARRPAAGRAAQPRERDGGGAAGARGRRRSRQPARAWSARFDGLPHRTSAWASGAASPGTTTPRAPTSAPRQVARGVRRRHGAPDPRRPRQGRRTPRRCATRSRARRRRST